MVVLTPKFTSLLAFVVSSSIVVDALPYRHERGGLRLPLPAMIPRHGPDVEARGHHHHHHKGHHGGHGTKVHADDPVIVSGDRNHVHIHSHKRHRHHSHHGHHGHHGTKIHADDPLIVSGDNNHVHSHTHKRTDSHLDLGLARQLVSLGTRKNHHHHHHHHHHQGQALELTAFKRDLGERGLLDPLVPLAGGLPGVAGVIGLVNMLSHTVLSDTLANLIISPTSSAMGIQSVDGEQMPSYTINASNSSSTTMYLVAQNATANVGPSEQIVLITMPMLNSTDKSVKMYCASYDPNSTTASQLSSQPCSYNPYSGLDINSTSTHFSQLFSWNIDTGEIWPLWQRGPNAESMTNTASVPDESGSVGGYVIGGSALGTYSAQQSGPGGKLAMVFKLASFSTNNATVAPPASSVEPSSVMTWSDDCDEEAGDPQAGDDDTDDSPADASSGDYETFPSTASNDATDEDTSPEDVQSYGDATAGVGEPGSPPTSTIAIQDARVVTSTFTMLVAPTESADVSTTASPASTTS
ncbi:hypothetical protein FRC08_002365 [Ceratobasidium sp. 394]|nr:hypothetical protein FRC08_002365 [Ceratobasidium sp. 394]